MPHQNEVSLSRKTIVRVLSAITVFLLVTSVTWQLAKHAFGYDKTPGIIRLFNVNAEGNVPTFFSTFLLLFAALLLALITTLKRKVSDTRWCQWAILSFIFLSMAVDEASGIHESLHRPGQWLLGSYATGIFTYAWVIFGIAFVLTFAIAYLQFYLHLDPQAKKQFFFAAIAFLGGAIGMELWESYYNGLHGKHNLPYAMLTTVEEGLEMAGIIIFINALLAYVMKQHEEILLRFDELERKSILRDVYK